MNVSKFIIDGTEVNLPVVPTSEINANTSARHTHSNKSVLDGITSTKVSTWDAMTDAHVNSLIDTKLGVIENGSY